MIMHTQFLGNKMELANMRCLRKTRNLERPENQNNCSTRTRWQCDTGVSFWVQCHYSRLLQYMHVHNFSSNYYNISILVQVRGIGTDIAIVSCMVFLAQVKLLHCCIALAFLR